jgi:hypothetical protein
MTNLPATDLMPLNPAREPDTLEGPQDNTEDTIVVQVPSARSKDHKDQDFVPEEPYEEEEPRRQDDRVRRSGRTRRLPNRDIYDSYNFSAYSYADLDELATFTVDQFDDLAAYLTHKERADLDLAIKLRSEGVITAPGRPFEASIRTELQSLMDSRVFRIEQFNPGKHGNTRIFSSRFVNEIKGKTTTPFEKSRLVIQAYIDDEKVLILT